MAPLPLFWCFAGVFGGLDLVVVPDLLSMVVTIWFCLGGGGDRSSFGGGGDSRLVLLCWVVQQQCWRS
jgi:hypothetical protein